MATDSDEQRRDEAREKIALRVIVGSSIATAALAVAVIGASVLPGNREALNDNIQQVFNALLPLLGTWVGTVLAFYFSSHNFQVASQSIERSNQTVQDMATSIVERLRAIPVSREMIPRSKIEVLTLESGADPESKIEFKSKIYQRLIAPPKITRLPVVDPTDRLKYLIHESMAYKFAASLAMAGDGVVVANKSLADLLADETMKKLVTDAVAFVRLEDTLAEAKTAMEAVPDCQDVFVTARGSRDEPVLGWLTNVTIASASRA